MKTDKVDARTLAALLRADMLPTCYVPGEELRSRRELLRHRLNLVKTVPGSRTGSTASSTSMASECRELRPRAGLSRN